MKYDVLYNFISPQTGKILIPKDYILLGDNKGFSYSSPALEHLKLDYIKLQKYLDDNTIFIDNTFDIQKRIRLNNLPLLGAAKFPLPEPSFFDPLNTIFPNTVVEALKEVINLASELPIPNPTYDPFNVGDWVMNAPFMPQIIAGNPHVRLDGGIDPETIISSTTAFLHIAIAKVKKQLQYGGFIVKKRNISWVWDNVEKINNITGVFDVLANKYPTITQVKDLFLSLYNLNSNHTFSENTQVLEELLQDDPLNVGHKKGGVLALTDEANMRLAISGEDYVDYKNIPSGYLCLIDPLANEYSDKFITKTGKVQVRDPDPDERVRVRLPEANWEAEEVKKVFEFTDIYLKFKNFVNNIIGKRGYSRLAQIDEDGFLVESAVKARFNRANEFVLVEKTKNVLEVDYITVKNLIANEIPNSFVKTDKDGKLIGTTDVFSNTDAQNIIDKLNKISLLVKLLVGVKDTVDILSITTDQAKNLNTIVKAIGGIKDATDMVDIKPDDAKKLVKTVSNVVGSAAKEAIEDTLAGAATKAVDIFTNKAALLEIEEQIAALAGVTAINTLWNLFNTIGIATTAISGRHYGEYIRGQTLNIKNTWQSTDLNDECANATGDFRPFDFTPYKYENRGHGTIWFDSNGRKSKVALLNEAHPPEYYSEAGVRIMSYDSSSIFDNEISPIHLGLFGYKKFATQPDEYKGFIFRAEFDNNSKIPNTGVIIDDDNPNYRFPTKFGLYDVHRTVSSNSRKRYGWDTKDTIFEYDYNSFNFSKPVQTKKLVATDNLTIPSKLSSEIPTDSATGSIFYCSDL